MLTVKKRLLPLSAARCGKKLRRFSGVTIHETGNRGAGADAESHMLYMTQNGGSRKEVSYHYVVDEKEAWHLIPEDEVAWHAGDGADGKGNNETLAVEICVNADGDFAKAVENAARLTAALLYERQLHSAKGYIFEHHDFSRWGKNCPADLRAGKAGGMAYFRQTVQDFLDEFWRAKGEEHLQPAVPKSLYRVQAGAFSKKENALQLQKKLQQAGFDCYVTGS